MTSKTQISTRAIFAFLLVIGLVLTNCDETNLSPVDNNSSETSISDVRAKKGGIPAGMIPNSQRYNDSSMPSASGRDGEVTVTARAMIDVDGNTTLEVTTAALDGDNRAPGTITKQQVKALDTENPDSDNPVWVENYNRLRNGGYFTANYTGLERGQQLALHTNVKGIIRGTAVVFVDETIKARPDITVSSIDAPAQATVGEAVTIFAELSELNGDLGATLNCILSVDGEELSGAYGIWVNAGDTVGCMFEETFESAGEKNIIISAEDVIPGDFDMSNNQIYTTIEVLEPQNNDNSFYRWFSSFHYYEYDLIERSLLYQRNNTFSVQGWASFTDTWNVPEYITGIVSSDGSELNTFSYETFGRTSGFVMSRVFFYYFYSGTELTTYININGNSAIYFSRDMFGDLYVSRSYENGVVYDRNQLGNNIEFEFDFGGAILSGEYPISVTSDTETEFRISGNSSFYEEVGAESEDEEGENDEEEEY